MNKKSLFTLTLSSVLLLSSTTTFANTYPTNANESNSIIEVNSKNEKNMVSILKDSKVEIVVKEVQLDGVTIATRDKITNILTIEKYDISGETLVSSEILDLNEIESLNQQAQRSSQQANLLAPEVSAYAVNKSYQNTFMNREYEIYFFDDGLTNWRIRSDDRRKTVSENSGNRGNLDKFRSAVERVNSGELAVISAAGFTAAATILTAFLSGGLAAGIAIAGTGGTVTTALYTVNSAVSDADYYFNRVR